MRFFLLPFIFSLSLFALSSNNKIVIESYNNLKDARKAYQKLSENPNSIVQQYAEDEAFIIHFRKSGGRYIIAAEPFIKRADAETVLKKIKPDHPNAFISRGVADDIQFLLMKHRQEQSKKRLPQNNTIPLVDNKQQIKPLNEPNTTTDAIQTPKIPTQQDTNLFPMWSIIFILLVICYVIWREWKYNQLKSSNKLLLNEKISIQDSLQAKNDFIAMMSHEIRAPINAIMGISHLILESDLSEIQRSQMNKIKDSAAILLTLINDILDHSKIEAGKVTIEQIPFDLNGLLDDISNIISHKAEEKNIEVIFDIEPNVPNKLIGDPLRLLQVLVNLLNNAIKFTETGSVVLRARAQHSSRLNLNIHFDIIDTGIGMDTDQISNLFQSYSQGDNTISRKYGGTGLGLVICKNLITLMGGTIRVRSTPGQGSTFSFDIKLHSDLDFEKRHYRLPTKELMTKNTLIVDSNPDSSTVLQRGLEYFHYETKTAENSLDAMSLLMQNHYDIVFIDTKLSLRGDFKKEIQQRIKNENVKLVWLGDSIKKREGFILQKPFNQLNIYNVILSIYGYMDQSSQHESNTKKLKENLKKFAGETLLLAEDNEINRSIISGLLAGTEIKIITAENGKEAAEKVEAHNEIGVVLMDIQMPIMDGFEAAKLIRKNPEKDIVSIIAVTGNTFESDIEKISSAGMNGHIAKPIDINTFYTTLFYAFEKSRNQPKK